MPKKVVNFSTYRSAVTVIVAAPSPKKSTNQSQQNLQLDYVQCSGIDSACLQRCLQRWKWASSLLRPRHDQFHLVLKPISLWTNELLDFFWNFDKHATVAQYFNYCWIDSFTVSTFSGFVTLIGLPDFLFSANVKQNCFSDLVQLRLDQAQIFCEILYYLAITALTSIIYFNNEALMLPGPTLGGYWKRQRVTNRMSPTFLLLLNFG